MNSNHPFDDETQSSEDDLFGGQGSDDSFADSSQEPASEFSVHANETASDNDANDMSPIEKLELELASANDRWVRTEAELDNFRKRTRREMEDIRKYASADLLTELLGVMDNLQRAIDSADDSSDGAGLLEGVKMVAVQLQHTLTQHGCEPIKSVGESFDPNRHEAVIMEPTDDYPANSIIREMRPGYQLNGRILRPPQVVVAAPANAPS